MHFNTKDLTGMVFDHMYVIKLSERRLNDNRVAWVCQCVCGKTVIKTGKYLQDKRIKNKSCGCARGIGRKLKVAKGTKIGKLTVLGDASPYFTPNGDNHTMLKCDCECGSIKIVNASGFLKGSYKTCGSSKCRKTTTSKQMVVNHEYKCYKYNAKKRNYTFELTKDEFKDLIYDRCYYCGTKGGNLSKLVKSDPIAYNGVDRVENSKGYTIDNCVSCCGTCNMMKMTLSQNDFIDHMMKIIHNLDLDKG